MLLLPVATCCSSFPPSESFGEYVEGNLGGNLNVISESWKRGLERRRKLPSRLGRSIKYR